MKQMCGCADVCPHWQRVQEAKRTEDKLAKMWEKAARNLSETRSVWFDHLMGTVNEKEEAA